MLKVSIMIPTYNQEKYILVAIKSALNQTYQNFEVVVNDDNSTDNTWNKINTIQDKRLKIYKNDKNIGRVKNYRKLLYELASGDYVINLDGDDYLIDNKYIENAINLIINKKVALVFSNQIIKNKNKNKKTNMNLKEVLHGNWLFLNYGKHSIHIPHMTALYNRNKAKKLNFYSKDIISSDWESILRYIINKKIGFLQSHSGVWRQIDNSESKPDDIYKIFDNMKYIKSVRLYANSYFEKEMLDKWENRIKSNLLKDISWKLIYCNISKILNYAYKELSLYEYIKLVMNYRFLGKLFIGKVKSKCVA